MSYDKNIIPNIEYGGEGEDISHCTRNPTGNTTGNATGNRLDALESNGNIAHFVI